MAADRAGGERMTTTLRNAWIAPQPTQARRIYVTIKQDGRHGVVWDGVSFAVQMARDRIAVCFEDGQPATYYTADEVEIERHSNVQSSPRRSVTR